ncbi:hypothetical protein BDK51DRAFT_51616 [Blyttiomyces helicus]|uniref:Uncharacterized protein n=1 Tax=Blyttiomyces helicus TaxID=388810 RepID=A0A4V1IQE9_9FUNG|nr:hypothetical protein BDK51DRAFT_51616 [Blyttiomyces helicus]|eukprot:RKO86317.1 hypothetical protein BDK51DRAFT_51616 [Blyttiomyces helicus]
MQCLAAGSGGVQPFNGLLNAPKPIPKYEPLLTHRGAGRRLQPAPPANTPRSSAPAPVRTSPPTTPALLTPTRLRTMPVDTMPARTMPIDHPTSPRLAPTPSTSARTVRGHARSPAPPPFASHSRRATPFNSDNDGGIQAMQRSSPSPSSLYSGGGGEGAGRVNIVGQLTLHGPELPGVADLGRSLFISGVVVEGSRLVVVRGGYPMAELAAPLRPSRRWISVGSLRCQRHSTNDESGGRQTAKGVSA